MVIDHVGLEVEVRDVPLLPLFEPILAMSTLPNVAVKATALPCAVSEPYPFPSLHEPFRRLLEAFGADRVFWGTDLTRLPCPYAEGRSFVDEMEFLTPSDREWILGRGIEEWLRWRR